MSSLSPTNSIFSPLSRTSPSGSEYGDGESPLGAHHSSGYHSDPTLALSPSDEVPETESTVRGAASRRASAPPSPASSEAHVEGSYFPPDPTEVSTVSDSTASLASTSSSAPWLKVPSTSSLDTSRSVTSDSSPSAFNLAAIKEASEDGRSIISVKTFDDTGVKNATNTTGSYFLHRQVYLQNFPNLRGNKVAKPAVRPAALGAPGLTDDVEPKKKERCTSSTTTVVEVDPEDPEDGCEIMKKIVFSVDRGPGFSGKKAGLEDWDCKPGPPSYDGEDDGGDGKDKFVWSWRYFYVFAMACFGGLLFGYDTGYISGVMAMDFVENMQLTNGFARAYNQRAKSWRSVTSIRQITYSDGNPVLSRNESWVSTSGQQSGAGLAILGPITVNSLFQALNYTETGIDFDHLDVETKEEIEAAFGWNDSRQPPWLLLDENVRPFWVCNITGHHTHRLGGDHHDDKPEKPLPDYPGHAKFHHRLVVSDGQIRWQNTQTQTQTPVAKLNHHPRWFHLPAQERLLVVGMLSIGTAVGAIMGGDLSDYLGRRVTLMIGTVVFMFGVSDQLASEHLNSLTRGRFESGIAVGIVTGVIVVYLTEISPAHIRGHVTVMFQFSITLGLLLSACVTMTTRKVWSLACYRIPISIQFIWAFGLLAGLCVLPESPRWYVKVGRFKRAKLAVMELERVPMPGNDPENWKSDPGVEQEMKEIMYGRHHHSGDANVAPEEKEQNFTVSRYCRSWKLCFAGPWHRRSCNFKRTLFGAALMMFQQLTGVNFVFYFGAAFFKQQGFSNPFVLAVGLGAVNVASTLASFIIVPATRRRMLLMSGAAAMGICQLTVGLIDVVYTLRHNDWESNGSGSFERPQHVPAWFVWTTMTAISLYIFCYATTWGPGAWILLGEVFPMEIRARAIGIATATNWIFNSFVCFVTPLMVDKGHGNLGMWVFLIWSGTSVAAFLFVFLFVPETAGRTLEEVAFKFDFGTRTVREWSLEKKGGMEKAVEAWAWARNKERDVVVDRKGWRKLSKGAGTGTGANWSSSGGCGDRPAFMMTPAGSWRAGSICSTGSDMSGVTILSDSGCCPPPYMVEDYMTVRPITGNVKFANNPFAVVRPRTPREDGGDNNKQGDSDEESISPKTTPGRD